MSRNGLTESIAQAISKKEKSLRQQWDEATPVKHFVLDDVLPTELAHELAANFPSQNQLSLKSSLKERKWVGVDVNRYHPIVGDALMAFQAEPVLKAIEAITGLKALKPDPSLYASGVSAMWKGDFLNPHLDNSHDGDDKTYRVLNLLYYCSPEWTDENGGLLELWKPGLKDRKPVSSRFNRLVVMGTDRKSWHSVNEVLCETPRYCVSNYYFSSRPLDGDKYRHVTTFRGRPDQSLRTALLSLDATARNLVRRLIPRSWIKSRHRLHPPSET